MQRVSDYYLHEKKKRFYFIKYRLLFWSDVGVYPSIRRSTLTGRQVTYIITTNIRWPNGLTIDFDDDRIYWADAWL